MPENDIWEIRLATKVDAEEMLGIYTPFITDTAGSSWNCQLAASN